ncbi:MAG: hypothetical protein AB1805_10290 [Nitrospirota bacterium]
MNPKSLLKNITVLNLLLLGGVLLFAQYGLLPLFNIKITLAPIPAKAVVEEKKEEPAAGSEQHAIPPLMEYTVIAEQNVFHPDRKIPPLKQPEKVVPKPEFVLYGTLVTDTVSLAYLSDKKAPRSTPGRGQRQTALKIGDSLSGYTLKEVHHQKVVMVRGEDRVEVKVIAADKSKGRSSGDKAAAAPGGEAVHHPEEEGVSPATPPPSRPPQRPQAPGGVPGGKRPSNWRF